MYCNQHKKIKQLSANTKKEPMVCLEDNRPKSILQKKKTEPKNNSPKSEVVQKKPDSKLNNKNLVPEKPIQLKTLGAAGLNGAFLENRVDTPLFDSPRMANGWQYNANILCAANNYSSVLNAYNNTIRPLGNSLHDKVYTDKRIAAFNNMPSSAKWTQKRNEFIPPLIAEGILEDNRPYFDIEGNIRPILQVFASNDHNALRNNNELATIDPFVTKTTITPPLGANAWEIDTQFADSGTGYITKIKRGDLNISGSIDTSHGFNATKNNAAATNADFKFSSTHDQGPKTFGQKIGGMSAHHAGSKIGTNHEGFDALTWIAAEGARFEPVRELGDKASPQSLFFNTTDNWKQIRAVNLSWLMQNWKDSFGKRYNNSAIQISTVVGAAGRVMNLPINGLAYKLNVGRVINVAQYRKWRAKRNWQKLQALGYVTPLEVTAIQTEVGQHKAHKKAYFEAGRPGHERPDPVG